MSLPADTRQEILDLITELASALSEGNGLAFLDHIDHAMPDYQKLEQNILALTEQNEVSAAIDILKQEGDDRTQTVELDWLLQIRSREENGPIERRRETVKCRAERKKKNWKIVSLDPTALFAPPQVR
jgi:murein L,D-transpeptidase YcbB/YkuD